MKVKVFIIIFMFLVSFSLAANHEETIKKTFDLNKNGEFFLKNINGTISIQTHSEDKAIVKAVKSARDKKELAYVEVKFEYSENKLKVFTKRKKSRSNVRVNFEIWIPEKLEESSIKTVNGEVKMDGIYNQVEVASVNGKIRMQGSFGDAECETVNGSIGIYCKTKLSGNLDAETVNGSIKMELPKKSDFIFEADTLNGSISSAFSEVSIKKGFIGKSAKGTIGSGSYKVSVETVNGSIKVLGN